MFCAMRHAHAVQRLGDKRFALARSHSSIRQRQLDILKDGEIPYQIEALKNEDRKSTRLNSSHSQISYAVFCLKKKKQRTLLGSLGAAKRSRPTLGGVHGTPTAAARAVVVRADLCTLATLGLAPSLRHRFTRRQ